MSTRLRALAIGARAHAALERTDGVARVLVRLHGSVYATVGETIVWLGGWGAALHPRAILTDTPIAGQADDVRLDVTGLTPWHPSPLALDAAGRARLAGGWPALAARAADLGAPGGFGVMLTGAPLSFPLDGAAGPAVALAGACARDDPAGAVDAAVALLGLGGGLTPSGDDFVGGALFVRAALATGTGRLPWRRAAGAVVAAAPVQTHPISVALLADLAEGRGWAPLHDLVAALAAADARSAEAAARALVGLGHTSGWDLLAGVGAGLGALT